MKKTKMDSVYEYIRDRINSNDYPPNMKITEAGVCSELGVSRTPVREAIRKLISEDYLIFTPGIGITVTNIDLMDLIEVYEIREVLEGIAIRLFIERKSPPILNNLKTLIIDQKKAFKENNSSAFMEYDMEFHQTIFQECGNKRLQDYLENIYKLINRVAFVNKDDPYLDQIALQHHEDLYAHIEANEKEAAVQLVQDHIRELKAYYLKRYYNL